VNEKTEKYEKTERWRKDEKIGNFLKTASSENETIEKIEKSQGTGDLGGARGFGRIV
jgi:hypothetical protein